MQKTLVGLGILFLSHVMGTSMAFAYIPPSQFIVRTWINKHGGVKNVKVRSNVTAFVDDKPTDVHFKETTIYNSDTNTIKSWVSDDSDRKLFVIEKNAANLSTISKLLFMADSREVVRVLRDRGIPIRLEDELLAMRTELERTKSENESIARWNGGLAWVIGSVNPPDAFNPQLWFEKDTFLPLRMIFVSPKDRETYDFRVEGYRYSREFPYPRVLSVIKKGNGTLFSSQLLELAVNADQSKGSRGDSSTPGYTDAGNSLSSAQRDLIRQYYDVVR